MMFLFIIICVALRYGVTGSPFSGVVNGTDVFPGQIPYVVSLQERMNHVCSGTIIDKYWILTAAHCVINKTQRMTIEAGTVRLRGKKGFIMPVEEIVIHPSYVPLKSKAHDIAILRLELPLTFSIFIRFIALPEEWTESPEGAVAFLFGWGLSQRKRERKPVLQFIEVVVIPDDECNKKYENDIQPDGICVRRPAGGVGQCIGDTGGIIMINGLQVGVVTHKLCVSEKDPAFLTNIYPDLNWIRTRTHSSSECSSPKIHTSMFIVQIIMTLLIFV